MSWTDRIVGARMAADREFDDRLTQSSLSRGEWGLVMTATEFEIENPDDPENARLVGNTDKLPSVVPEMKRIEEQGPMGGQGGDTSSGLFGSIKSALGMGGGKSDYDESKVNEATAMVGEYTDLLQRRLRENGRWTEVCEAAAEERETNERNAE